MLSLLRDHQRKVTEAESERAQLLHKISHLEVMVSSTSGTWYIAYIHIIHACIHTCIHACAVYKYI